MMRPICHATPAAMGRARLGEHGAVVAQRRGLGTENELDVLEPRVRERAEHRAAAIRLRRGTCTRGGELGLSRLDDVHDAAARLELRQVPRRRSTAPSPPVSGAVPDEPGASTRRRRTREPSALRHLTAQTGSSALVVSTSRNVVESGS
jgi:hypothetical protein